MYTVGFFYPDGWAIKLKDLADPKNTVTEEEHVYLAEGNCEGRSSGEYHRANHPRRGVDRTFGMNLQGFTKTGDGALIMTDYRGYSRAYTVSRRQVDGAAWHVADSEKYRWLNDTVCAIAGEVRAPTGIPPEQLKRADIKLVFDVAEIVWESPAA